MIMTTLVKGAAYYPQGNGCKGAWADGPISGWVRLQWWGKATSPGPRGGDADAPKADGRSALDGRTYLTYQLSVCRRPG